jgi:hypothetical protein
MLQVEGLQGKPPSRLPIMEHCFSVARGLQVQVRFNEVFELSFHEVCVCSKWRWGDLRGSPPSIPHGTSFQFTTRSAGQVRRSLLSVGPLLYRCSTRSMRWLCVLSLYWVATRRISSTILGMWRSLWSGRLLTYRVR